jgi:DNA-binding XRE family transcriptional regulator
MRRAVWDPREEEKRADTQFAARLQKAQRGEQQRLVRELAEAVRGMREEAGLTQEQLGRRVGTSQPAIGRIENGLVARTPQWDTLRRIAAALGRELRIVFAEERGVAVEVEPGRRRGR